MLRLAQRAAPSGDPVATDVLRLRASAGVAIVDIDRLPPRAARALAVATSVGAPAIDALDGAAAAEDDARRAERAVAVASAQTRAVAGGLLAAPVVLVPLLGRLVGADPAAFYTSPPGVAVALVGGLLLATGAVTVVALVRRVGRHPRSRSRAGRLVVAASVAVIAARLVHPVAAVPAGLLVLRGARRRGPPRPGADEAVDLTATAMAGGVPASAALRVASDHLPELACELRRLAFDLEMALVADGTGAEAQHDVPLDRLRAVLVAAGDVGAPVVPTLRRLARDLRADDLARTLAATERLPAQLTFPTALCLLPATVLLVGAPIVHAGLTAVGT